MNTPDNDTLDYIRRTYIYDPHTGIICRKTAKGMRAYTCNKNLGYIVILARKKSIKGHRLAWFLHYNEWPKGEIDHIDRNKSNNKIANLRIATRSQQSMNSGKTTNNSVSVFRGVHWNKGRNIWQAYIYKDRKHIYIGAFENEIDAARAYIAKAIELHGQFVSADVIELVYSHR